MLGHPQRFSQAQTGLGERRDFGLLTHDEQQQTTGRLSCPVLQQNGSLVASFLAELTGLAASTEEQPRTPACARTVTQSSLDRFEHQHARPLLKDLFSEQKYAVQEGVLWGRKLGHL